MKSRTCHASAGWSRGRRACWGAVPAPGREPRGPCVDQPPALRDGRTGADAGRAGALDAPQLHAQRREHLANVIVQLARQALSLLLLRVHEPLRELAHLPLGALSRRALLRRSAFEHPQADDDDERDGEAEQQAAPLQAMQVGAEGGVPSCHFVALLGDVEVVQRLDFLRDRQHRIAARHDFLAEKGGALENFFGGRPVEEGSKVCQ